MANQTHLLPVQASVFRPGSLCCVRIAMEQVSPLNTEDRAFLDRCLATTPRALPAVSPAAICGSGPGSSRHSPAASPLRRENLDARLAATEASTAPRYWQAAGFSQDSTSPPPSSAGAMPPSVTPNDYDPWTGSSASETEPELSAGVDMASEEANVPEVHDTLTAAQAAKAFGRLDALAMQFNSVARSIPPPTMHSGHVGCAAARANAHATSAHSLPASGAQEPRSIPFMGNEIKNW